MEQLIIEGIHLPQTKKDSYRAYQDTLSQQIDMISGRRVIEKRGTVWRIEYAADYIGQTMMQQLITTLRRQTDLTVYFLPNDGNEMLAGLFCVESMQQPVFAFSRYGLPYWHNVSFTLREVKPRD